MEIGVIVETISTLGFPIALTIACVWFFYKIYTWQRDDMKERENKDREVIEKFSVIIATNSEALLENANVMQQISSKLEDVDEKLDNVARDVQEIKNKQQNK